MQALLYQFCVVNSDADWPCHQGELGVENSLHWVLDVVFHDDLTRLRTGFSAQNMTIMRHAALNIINKMPDKKSKKNKRNSMDWNKNSQKYAHSDEIIFHAIALVRFPMPNSV